MTIDDELLDARLRPLLQDAALQLGASPELRRRVTDATPRRTLRPLAAALAVAVAAGASGALLARAVHRGAVSAPAAHPTGRPSPSASPTPAPPVRFPAFFAPSDLTLSRPLAYGRLSLTGTDNTLAIGRYVLAVSRDPGNPATAPVWVVDRSPAPGAAHLDALFGNNGTPDPDGVTAPPASYDPDLATVWFNSGTLRRGGPQLDRAPTSAADAAELATSFLERRGLLALGMGAAEVTTSPPGEIASTYGVAWSMQLDGHLVWGAGAQSQVSIGDGAEITNVTAGGLRVAGGSDYPLIPWRQAWQQVAAGNWFAERGGFTGGNGQSRADVYRATSVQLAYLSRDDPPASRTGSEQDKLVPMWMFSDGSILLFYPAVSPTELSYRHVIVPFPTH